MTTYLAGGCSDEVTGDLSTRAHFESGDCLCNCGRWELYPLRPNVLSSRSAGMK
jgi:hypothetical protein